MRPWKHIPIVTTSIFIGKEVAIVELITAKAFEEVLEVFRFVIIEKSCPSSRCWRWWIWKVVVVCVERIYADELFTVLHCRGIGIHTTKRHIVRWLRRTHTGTLNRKHGCRSSWADGLYIIMANNTSPVEVLPSWASTHQLRVRVCLICRAANAKVVVDKGDFRVQLVTVTLIPRISRAVRWENEDVDSEFPVE